MSSVPYFIAKRPFLPGAEGPWVERVRARMREVFLKSADLRSGVFLWNKEFEHAIRMAEDAIALDPFRESAYRRLMQAYRASGSRADAIRAYERCSEILNRELGIEPSAETKALHDEVRGGDGKSRTPDERVFATILFTDIVSSSPRSSSLGDRRWRDVLDRHDAIIHEQLDRFGGKLIKTTGDGILATFEAPARAVICARHIEEAMGALDIQIRVGLHAGEVEQRSEDVSGIAVVIARRVCDTGDAGDVLVSRTLVDLVAGAGIDFVDRGEHELKGVPGHWQLFALRPTPS
jgi:class 3 adenylate cyclase